MSRELIAVRIDGPPKGKGVAKSGRGRHYTPADTEAEMARIAMRIGEVYGGPMLTAPITLFFVAVLARPKTEQRKKDPDGRYPAPVKPDGSNVQKLLEDALQRCRVCGGQKPTTRSRKSGKCKCGRFCPTIGDDAWITSWHGSKKRAARDLTGCGFEEPHVYVEIVGVV